MQVAAYLLSQLRTTFTEMKEKQLTPKEAARQESQTKVAEKRQSMILEDPVTHAVPKPAPITEHDIQEVETTDQLKSPEERVGEHEKLEAQYDALVKADEVAKNTLPQVTKDAEEKPPADQRAQRSIMDQTLSRLSKFGLAVKAFTQDIVMSPIRLLNVPIQLGLSLALFGQSIYHKKTNSNVDSDKLKVYSKAVLTNAFVSGGAAPIAILGSTIGLITAPMFNTKHFTGKFGPVGIKMMSVFVVTAFDTRHGTAYKLRYVKDCLNRANNPKILYKMKQESGERISFQDSFKLAFQKPPDQEFESKTGNGQLSPKERALNLKHRQFKEGGALFNIAQNLYVFAMHMYQSKSTFYLKVANDPLSREHDYLQTKNEAKEDKEIRGRPRSDAKAQKRFTSSPGVKQKTIDNLTNLLKQSNQANTAPDSSRNSQTDRQQS